jgi:hypothetical protein
MCTSSTGQVRPSQIMESYMVRFPMATPWRVPRSSMGACDIDSMPPATTTSASPDRMRRAARLIALSEEAHTLFTESDGTLEGIPARSAACRAGT